MAIAIVEELWTRIRAAIDDKIVVATDARDQAVTAKNGAVAAQTAAEAAAAAAGEGGGGVSEVTAANISDATTVGRNVLKATDAAAARTAIGAGTSNLALGTTSSTAKAGDWKPATADITDATTVGRAVLKATDAAAARSAIGAAAVGEGGGIPDEHEHTVEQITDATTVGRAVLKATDAAAARSAIGAGTSNLTIGTTSATAKAGDWRPAAADITDATAVGQSVVKAATAAAARTAIGAGTSNLALGTTSSTAKAGNYQPTAANISDATTVGRNVLKATDAAAARTAIGAGTSNLTLGTTAGTAKAGDWKPATADITDLPPIRSAAVADSLVQRSPTGNVLVADTPSGPSSATSRTYVETYVASQLGQAGSTIVPVEQLPANPDPTTFYAVMGPGVTPEPAALATYQLVGTPAAGADFPGTAVPSTFGFESNPGGWYAGASHGLTPPVAGLYTIKVTASPANGPVTIYPYVNGAWGASIAGTGDTATAALQLTTSDAVYYDVVPTTGGVPVTLTVKMYAGVV